MTRPWKFLVAYAALLASVAIVIAVLLFIRTQNARYDRAVLTTQSDQRLCREVESLKDNIRSVIKQSPPSASREKALAKFAKRRCAKLPTKTGLPLPH